MNRLTDDQKQALALLAVGAALAALALHPPKWLVKVYLTVEKAAALAAGLLLAVAGASALLGLDSGRQAAAPDYTIEFDEDEKNQ